MRRVKIDFFFFFGHFDNRLKMINDISNGV